MKLLSDKNELYVLVNDLSLKYFQIPFRHTVRFNYRLRTTGGRYIPSEKTIELNPKYVLEMDMDEVIGIIKHELCHYHLHIQGKGYRHGDADFKQLLQETGSPRYCNPLPSSRRARKHLYICKECKYEYRRVRRVNTKRYRCGKCSGKLKKVNN